MLFVRAVNSQEDRLQPGSSLHIRFSHDTNMPPVLRPADLRRILTLNPPGLSNTSHMAFWTYPHTLSVIFPTVREEDEPLSLTQISVSFNEMEGTMQFIIVFVIFLCTLRTVVENCESTDVCEYGICHSDGWSCRVTGFYGVNQTAILVPNPYVYSQDVLAYDNDQTPMHNWCLLFIALVCSVTAAVVTVAMQWKRK